MSVKHLKLTPHHLKTTDRAWWYETKRGIEVVVEPSPKTEIITISWAQVCAAVNRKELPRDRD